MTSSKELHRLGELSGPKIVRTLSFTNKKSVLTVAADVDRVPYFLFTGSATVATASDLRELTTTFNDLRLLSDCLERHEEGILSNERNNTNIARANLMRALGIDSNMEGKQTTAQEEVCFVLQCKGCKNVVGDSCNFVMASTDPRYICSDGIVCLAPSRQPMLTSFYPQLLRKQSQFPRV